MTRIKWLLFFLPFIFLTCCYANDASTTLNQLLKNTQSIQANFKETLLDKQGQALQQTNGHLYLQTPGLFRWEADQPSQLMIANGNRLWIYDKDLEQVTIRAIGHEKGEAPALLLSDAHPALENTFQVSLQEGSAPAIKKFTLVPKDKSSMYQSIELVFSGNQIQEMRLKDHLGHTTLIQFHNVKTNSKIPASLFKFTQPKNVDVIDETKKH